MPETSDSGVTFDSFDIPDSPTATRPSPLDPLVGRSGSMEERPAPTVVVEPPRYSPVLALVESSTPLLAVDPHDSIEGYEGTHLLYGDDPYRIRTRESALSTFDAYIRLTERAYSPILSDAFHDLEQVDEEARGDGSPVPSHLAHRNAHRMLERMFRICRVRYSVYPLHDGEIVIEAKSAKGSLLLVCRSDGRIGCSVRIERRSRTERYHDASNLPNGFMRDALRELTGVAGQPG